MLAEERFSLIMEQLNRKRTVTVQELCEALNTSESTIRRDLTELDRLGKLNKVHGGATLPDSRFLADEPTMEAKETLAVEQKRSIAQAAAELINADDFVFIDAGSTTLELVRALAGDALKASYVTNGVAHARALARKGCRVYLPGGLLRDPQTHSLLNSPFMDGIIFFMMLLFLLPGLAYGIGAGTLKNSRDAVALVNKSISGLAGFMVLIFFAAQFTACFNYSNLGTIISVKGADFLQSVGLTGLPLIVCFILLTAGINIFIAVDSAKWAIMAPIFVPMFMRLGLSPELTQAAYRIGDSSTNIIAPLMPFFVLTVAFFQKYDKDAGIGSVISTMLPYSGAFLLGWIVMFTVWYLTGLPLGPGSPLFYGL